MIFKNHLNDIIFKYQSSQVEINCGNLCCHILKGVKITFVRPNLSDVMEVN